MFRMYCLKIRKPPCPKYVMYFETVIKQYMLTIQNATN
jgi:hypothetical protein